ncbi:hypothetical protein ETH_00022635 [Eimeria tenella]|uniref:Retrotransposon gag domain-containing protein n=1 Tax=Eimeria tenella TaxID=5802 RepID=U6KTX5_EIMTE|nr:hypothetical protein ETH_00022635 [Eimeria tenella]CDJ41577.1 hypothetical protein ETH_00022635 [Eimeria tenella]|eukprot:XP_013232327.1 hypothetical protein ETH_00022635 [Eimeria tenella]
MPSGTSAHHRHATPKLTVPERPHGRKEAPPQVIPMTNVLPGDSPFVTWYQFQSAISVIRTVIGRTVESSATIPTLPEDSSTMQAFLLRIERRYTQMGLEPREWGNARIDHLVGPALTYWMYLQRTIDLSDWATLQRRLFERFDKTMSQSKLLTELAKVRWSGNPKEYTYRFAAVAERGLGVAPDELADYYCTGLPTDLHLLITNNGQVKYQSWEQAATAAARLYEPKQSRQARMPFQSPLSEETNTSAQRKELLRAMGTRKGLSRFRKRGGSLGQHRSRVKRLRKRRRIAAGSLLRQQKTAIGQTRQRLCHTGGGRLAPKSLATKEERCVVWERRRYFALSSQGVLVRPSCTLGLREVSLVLKQSNDCS